MTASTQTRIDAALTPDELDHHGQSSQTVYTAGFGSRRDFAIRSILGKSGRGGAEPGEVLATVANIADDDALGWFTAWRGLGHSIADRAESLAQQGHKVSAARAYLRAANYLAVAVNAVDGAIVTGEHLLPTMRAHIRAWEGFVDHTRWDVQRVSIPYQDDVRMPGWFFRPDSSGTARPTLVVNNGSDGSLSGLWCQAAEGALERGYNVLLFNGPGQQSMLFERGIPFRYDWEKVLTPVVDHLLGRDDVDPGRLVVVGISQGGYWVPRALAMEHRFAAAAVDGGVVDVSRAWFDNLSPQLRNLYESDRASFDRYMGQAMQQPSASTARQVWEFRARPYGVTGYAAVLDEVAKYRLADDVAALIRTPLYIVDPDGEQFFPGQPAELATLVPTSTLARFRQTEGASYHCQPLARELTEQRIFDWFDDQLGKIAFHE
ncbi:dipeptidyl aminopeptidase [Glaciibacter flavus]|uniref:Dipeptidyl aminopeptidase n=1 Tax=Orlajensenia flava TaxID=2565934 RepID=A0A4S4FTB1_9MICO|nr:prolyl oligopeptidase family serine peptidase [Glaciibacter flavus]THG33989.1 dipeptidyl aminopeptidase [Glaciibacter flavus]